MLPDAHTHVHQSSRSLEAIAAAISAGVSPVIVCATSPTDFADVLRLRESFPAGRVLAGLGMHPWYLGDVTADLVGPALSTLHKHIRCDATLHVGEIGLDRSPKALSLCPLEHQVSIFRAQLGIAALEGRAVSVHCIRAFEDLVDSFRPDAMVLPEAVEKCPAPGLAGVLLHSWGGSLAQAQAIQDALPPGTPIAFSFQGELVWNVSEAFERALASNGRSVGTAHKLPQTRDLGDATCCCSPEAAVTTFRGASKKTMACLAQLPSSLLAFETDSPYQSFPTSPQFDAWCTETFACTSPSPIAGESISSSENSPDRVIRVVQAAAVWRCLHPANPPFASKRSLKKGEAQLVESQFTAPSMGHALPIPAIDTAPVMPGWPSASSVRTEFASLVKHATENVKRLFGPLAVKLADMHHGVIDSPEPEVL